jgi:hypothetical protein
LPSRNGGLICWVDEKWVKVTWKIASISRGVQNLYGNRVCSATRNCGAVDLWGRLPGHSSDQAPKLKTASPALWAEECSLFKFEDQATRLWRFSLLVVNYQIV